MLGDQNSKDLIKLIDDIFWEIRNRDDVYIAQDGNVYLKRCPDCECPVKVEGIQLNILQETIYTILESPSLGEYPEDRWKNFLCKEQSANHIKLPYVSGYDWLIPPPVPGYWYLCNCACRAGRWEASHDAAVASYMGMPVYKLIRAEEACRPGTRCELEWAQMPYGESEATK